MVSMSNKSCEESGQPYTNTESPKDDIAKIFSLLKDSYRKHVLQGCRDNGTARGLYICKTFGLLSLIGATCAIHRNTLHLSISEHLDSNVMGRCRRLLTSHGADSTLSTDGKVHVK